MRLSDQTIRTIAHTIRPHITTYLEDQGYVADEDVKKLSKIHTGHQVVSERTLRMIQEELMEC